MSTPPLDLCVGCSARNGGLARLATCWRLNGHMFGLFTLAVALTLPHRPRAGGARRGIESG